MPEEEVLIVPQEPPREDPMAVEIAAIIDQWFRDRVQGTILARDVDAYNHVHAAVEELKQRIKSRG